MKTTPVVDTFGREITSLRISVTDRCNFNCAYCMPEEIVEWFPHGEILTYEEIVRLTGIFSALGISKIKLTGGEPLMRRDLNVLVKKLCGIPGIEDISLTTNGYFLDNMALKLKDAGLDRVTVSLDSLKEERFNRLVGRKIFDRIHSNLLGLRDIAFRQVKVNVVVIRDYNDDELLDFVRFARRTGYIVRFIEFMPLDSGKLWNKGSVVSLDEMLKVISGEFSIEKIDGSSNKSPALRYKLSDGSAEIGFISSVSNPFCSQCGRIRLTADGHVRTCLFSDRETEIKSLIRGDAEDTEIREVLRKVLVNKEEGHLINQEHFKKPIRPMHQIGG